MNKSTLITFFLVNASIISTADTGNNAVIKADTGFSSNSPVPEKKEIPGFNQEAILVDDKRIKNLFEKNIFWRHLPKHLSGRNNITHKKRHRFARSFGR